MENSLERLEQIMKPYFDKQNEIEMLSNSNKDEIKEAKDEIAELKEKRKLERAKLELRLERLRANKDREIEEYVSSQPSFYAGYATTVRKDLEQAYKAQEDELIAEIKDFNKKTEEEIKAMENLKAINSRLDYSRVYLKEMIDVKESLRRPLIAEQKEITFALQREKINFDSVMLELSNFKYQYNDQHQVTNGLEWKELYEKSNQISNKINQLRNSLKVVEEYLNLTELTKEEIELSMSSLTPWEKAEYDRRKGSINEVSFEQNLKEPIEIKSKQELPQVFSTETEGLDNYRVSENLDNKMAEEQKYDAQNEQSDELNNSSETETEGLDNYRVSENLDNKVVEEQKYDTQIEESDELNNLNEPNNTQDSKIDIYSSVPEDLMDSYTPVNSNFDVQLEDKKSNVVVDNLDELSKLIYNDIMYEAENMHYIKLDPSSNPSVTDKYYFSDKESQYNEYYYDGSVSLSGDEAVELPNGEYLNSDDIDKAVKNYYKKSKGQNFIVKEINKTLNISKKQIRKLKKKLKQCSIVKLIKDERISESDVKRVYGKERYENLKNVSEMGTIKTPAPEGYYISRDEFISKLSSLFTSKKKRLEWLKKLSDKVKGLRQYEVQEEIENNTDNVVSIEDSMKQR